jgi:hypothetical protein
MKATTHEQPRFTCRVVRGLLAVFGDTTAGEPRGPGAAHVAACADCQAFFSACDELDVALKHDAARAWHEAPANLEQNILRAINLSKDAPTERRTPAPWLSLGSAATCAIVAVLVSQSWTPSTLPSRDATPTVAAATPNDPSVIALAQDLMAAVPTDLFDEMQPKAQALLQRDPYEDEVEAVKSDALTAVRFLAANFLPMAADGE